MRLWRRLKAMFGYHALKEDLVPRELHEASHRHKNESMQLKGSIRELVKSDDPFGDLAKAIRGCKEDGKRTS